MDHCWNDNDKGKPKYSDENLFSATLPPKKPTWIGLELNPGLRGAVDCKYLPKGKTCFKSRPNCRNTDVMQNSFH
jgi:hypothetical protein